MRRAARIDANHGAVVSALRAVGATVRSLASVGDGVPDLLVGYRGATYLLEVKDGAKPPSARRLTDAEADFLADWRGGPCLVVCSPEDALMVIGAVAP